MKCPQNPVDQVYFLPRAGEFHAGLNCCRYSCSTQTSQQKEQGESVSLRTASGLEAQLLERSNLLPLTSAKQWAKDGQKLLLSERLLAQKLSSTLTHGGKVQLEGAVVGIRRRTTHMTRLREIVEGCCKQSKCLERECTVVHLCVGGKQIPVGYQWFRWWDTGRVKGGMWCFL